MNIDWTKINIQGSDISQLLDENKFNNKWTDPWKLFELRVLKSKNEFRKKVSAFIMNFLRSLIMSHA